MPSHSMDLPVPRGISILMLGGQFTSNGTSTADVQCLYHIVSMFQWPAFVSGPSVSILAHAVKSPAFCQITSNYVFFVGVLLKLYRVKSTKSDFGRAKSNLNCIESEFKSQHLISRMHFSIRTHNLHFNTIMFIFRRRYSWFNEIGKVSVFKIGCPENILVLRSSILCSSS